MISEEEIERVIDFLRDAAAVAAQKRANRLHLEEYRKSLKSMIMKEHLKLPVSAQEREAYADPRYIEHLEALKTAIFLDEEQRYLIDAARVKQEAWKTMSWTERALRI